MALMMVSPAFASPRAVAGAWFDAGGSEVSLSSKAFDYVRLVPSVRDTAAIVSLFKDACVRVPVGTDSARSAIDARADWGFQFLDVDAGVPSGARLDGWQAKDVSVTSQVEAWPLAECNVLVNTAAATDIAPIVDMVSALVGTKPDKTYRTRSADGRRLDGQTMRWSAAGPAGETRHIYASAYTDMNGAKALHLGLTEARH
ncbi:hypothetical protein [uncultured Sphingomonas sp.]|uniref:hypothetical protein n=1 Tax=uncultured Sphingomonas sp. TaxID=158754 RepID=UPI0035CC8B89